MKCTVNVWALPLVSLGWSSLSIRGIIILGLELWSEESGKERAGNCSSLISYPKLINFSARCRQSSQRLRDNGGGEAEPPWPCCVCAPITSHYCLPCRWHFEPAHSQPQPLAKISTWQKKKKKNYKNNLFNFFFFLTLSVCWFSHICELCGFVRAENNELSWERSFPQSFTWAFLEPDCEFVGVSVGHYELKWDKTWARLWSFTWAGLYSPGGNWDRGIKPKMLRFGTRQGLSCISISPQNTRRISWLELKPMLWQPELDEEPALELCCVCLGIFWPWRLKSPSCAWGRSGMKLLLPETWKSSFLERRCPCHLQNTLITLKSCPLHGWKFLIVVAFPQNFVHFRFLPRDAANVYLNIQGK